MEIRIGIKKVLKVIFNTNILINQLNMVGFRIESNDKNGIWVGDEIPGTKGKKQYDGSYTFTYDASSKDYNDYIQIQKWWGYDNIIVNNLILEFDKSYITFDFNAYKKAL